MIKAPVYNLTGEKKSEANLPEFFSVEINPELLHQSVRVQMANKRLSTANAKTRGEISGGGRKPWRQKGTGNARAGSSRSPLWRGGGIIFGPAAERNYALSMPKKMRRLALKMAYALKAQDKEVILLEKPEIKEIKTSKIADFLKKADLEGKKTLFILDKGDEVMVKSIRNIASTSVKEENAVSVLDLLRSRNIILTQPALDALEGKFSPKAEKEEELTEKTEKKPTTKKTEKPVKAESEKEEKTGKVEKKKEKKDA